ncbi:MAG: TonB-dependent receptor, partial [Caulobacteraceae bacterium]|nr:TonB-dependent receptor [Caulobacteraceae bacterium]
TFYYDYKNLQSTIVCNVIAPPVCLVAPQTVTTNAAKSTVYGAEGQFRWQATDRLRFDGGVAYLHARYDRFQNANGFAPLTPTSTPACVLANQDLCRNIAVSQDWSGQQLIRAPDWSANISLSYEIPTSFGTFELNGNVSYVDHFQSDTDSLACTVPGCGVGLKPRLVVPARTVTDLTVSWRVPGDHIEASVFARNLFDKDYIFRTDGSTTGDYVIGAEPRVIGARLKYTY